MANQILNILWIDDQHESLTGLHKTATDYDIKLVPFKSLNGGLAELEKNYPLYDGVLLDAKFFEEEGDAPGTEDTYVSFRAKERIHQIPKKFEVFVLTGQAEAFDSDMFKKAFTNVFRKGIDKDEDHLFEELRRAALAQGDTQIKHEYRDVFDFLQKENFGLDAINTLLGILKSIKEGRRINDDQLYFTQLRIILEQLFRKANEKGLLHDVCLPKGKVNLTESSMFLSGKDTKHLGVRCTKVHFPKIISNTVMSFLHITGAASHTTDVDVTKNIDVKHYRGIVNTPYLLNSLTFQLMDVIVWFKEYTRLNPDTDTNKSYWESVREENYKGFICIDEYGNYYCGEHVLNKHYTRSNYSEGDEIVIKKSSPNTSRTANLYSKYADRFNRV